MALLLACGALLLAVHLLAGVLATGSVVARLAVHMRDDAWARITAQYGFLRNKERELLDAALNGTCVACGGRHQAGDHEGDRP